MQRQLTAQQLNEIRAELALAVYQQDEDRHLRGTEYKAGESTEDSSKKTSCEIAAGGWIVLGNALEAAGPSAGAAVGLVVGAMTAGALGALVGGLTGQAIKTTASFVSSGHSDRAIKLKNYMEMAAHYLACNERDRKRIEELEAEKAGLSFWSFGRKSQIDTEISKVQAIQKDHLTKEVILLKDVLQLHSEVSDAHFIKLSEYFKNSDLKLHCERLKDAIGDEIKKTRGNEYGAVLIESLDCYEERRKAQMLALAFYNAIEDAVMTIVKDSFDPELETEAAGFAEALSSAKKVIVGAKQVIVGSGKNLADAEDERESLAVDGVRELGEAAGKALEKGADALARTLRLDVDMESSPIRGMTVSNSPTPKSPGSARSTHSFFASNESQSNTETASPTAEATAPSRSIADEMGCTA